MTDEKAVFVRLPAGAADKLDRTAFELNIPKRRLIERLVSDHLDDVRVELPDQGMTVGRADVRPAPAPAVLSLEELAELLQVKPADVRRLAERGELPGRKIGRSWRFSREAVLAWLGQADS